MLANNALTTIDKARSFLVIEGTSKDSYIEQAVNAASGLIEKYCNREFGIKVHTQIVLERSEELVLEQFPVHRIVDVNGKVLDNPLLDTKSGILYQYVSHRSFVRYEAGYVLPKDETVDSPRTLPHDIEEACLHLISYLYADDEEASAMEMAKSLKSVDIGDFKASFGSGSSPSNAIPDDIKSMIESYRRRML